MSWMPDEQLIPTFIVDLPLAREALARARELHRGQHRESDRAPFILHPLEVAALLHNTGHPEHVVAAGILHDSIEDTSIHPQKISDRFGPQVAELVRTMTENPQIEPYQARKAALREQIAEFAGDAIAIYARRQGNQGARAARTRHERPEPAPRRPAVTPSPRSLPRKPRRARADHTRPPSRQTTTLRSSKLYTRSRRKRDLRHGHICEQQRNPSARG